MPQPTTTMSDLDQACATYAGARRELLKTAIAAHLGGVSANRIARRVAHVPGLNRNRVLAILAAGRREAAVRSILAADEAFGALTVAAQAETGGDEADYTLLCSTSSTPLGADAAHRLWTALLKQGLTVNRDDPEAALTALTAYDIDKADDDQGVTTLRIVDVRTRR